MDTDYSLDLKVTGMTCLSCSSAIRNLLLKVSEIKDTQVNILTGKVKILLSEVPKAHKVDKILKLITSAGFEAQIIPNHFVNYNGTDYKVDDTIIDVICSKFKFDSIQLTKPNAQILSEINLNIISIIKLKIVTENEIDNIVERLYNCKGIINIFSYKKWSKMLILYNSKELQLDEIIRKCNLSCGSFVMFSGSFEESHWNCRSQLNLKYTFKIENFEKTLFAKIISKYTKKSKDKLLLDYINSITSSYLYDLFGIYDFTVSEQKTEKDHVSYSNFISFSIFISYNPYFLSGKDLLVYINNILRLNKSEDIYFNDMIVKFIHYTILPSNSINNEYEHLRSKLNKRLWYYFRNFSISLFISIIVISISWLNNTDILNTIIRTLSISSIDSLSSISMVPGIPWNYLFIMFLVTPVVYICGHTFNKKAFQCIITGVPSMEVLISISMNTSFLYSVIMALYIIMVTIYSKYYDYSSINNDMSHSELKTNQSTEKFPHFLDTACLLTTISLFGKILEIRAKLLVYKILNNTESVSTPQMVNILDLNTMIYESVYKNYFTNFLCSIEKSSYSTEAYMSDINVLYQNDQLNFNNMVDVQLVELGDIILLSENDIIPYDGINLSVDAVIVNESVVTGESRSIEKLYGNSVLAGSKIIQGKIILHVRSIGTESTLGKIEALKRNAKENYVPLPSSIDKLALYFVPSVFLFALCCFIVWFTLAYYDIVDPTYMITLDRIDLRDEYISIFKKFPIGSKIMFGMHFALSVMAISCPCAIGITIPIVTLISTIKALNNDILVQSPHIFDSILKIKSIVFDKTGTLTNGKAQVISCTVNCYLSEIIQKIEGFNITEKSNTLPQSDIYFIPKKVNHKYPKYTTDTECYQMLWWLIGSAEYNSSHPIGNALRSYAASILLDKNRDKLANFTQPKWYKYFPGRGIVSIVENVKLILTNNYSTTLSNYPIVKATIKGADTNSDCMVTEKSYANLENWYDFWANQGATVVYIFIDEGYSEPFCPVDDLYSNKDKLVLIGSVALLDEHMNGSIECINYINNKISDNIWLCTGDSKCTAEAIALKVGIDIERVMSHALPGDKLRLVEDLKLDPRVAHIMNKVKQSYEEVNNNCDNYSFNSNTKRFETSSYINTSSFEITCGDTAKRVTMKKRSHNPVMMVGDGINDSAGLLAADIGILLGKEGLSDFSSADIVILSNYQYGLLFLLKLARETHKIIRSNLTWALVFNIVAIPLAAGILYPRVVIPPVAASLLMMLSSAIIILSSLSLYFYM